MAGTEQKSTYFILLTHSLGNKLANCPSTLLSSLTTYFRSVLSPTAANRKLATEDENSFSMRWMASAELRSRLGEVIARLITLCGLGRGSKKHCARNDDNVVAKSYHYFEVILCLCEIGAN